MLVTTELVVNGTKCNPFFVYDNNVVLAPPSARLLNITQRHSSHKTGSNTYLLVCSSLWTLLLICASDESNLLRKSLPLVSDVDDDENDNDDDKLACSDAMERPLLLRLIFNEFCKSFRVTISSWVSVVTPPVVPGVVVVVAAVVVEWIPFTKGFDSCNGLLLCSGIRMYSRRNKLSFVHMLFALFRFSTCYCRNQMAIFRNCLLIF